MTWAGRFAARTAIVAAGRHFQSAEQLARFANAFELFSRVSGCCGVLPGITKGCGAGRCDLAWLGEAVRR
jgi:hypothetical protein